MAVHKSKAIKKTSKKAGREHKTHKIAMPEIHQDVSNEEQTPVSESTALPTVISSGVLPYTSKEENPQVGTSSQPVQQSGDALTPQPPSATSSVPSTEASADKTESLGVVTQNPLVEDVSKDKPVENIEEPKKKKPWVIIVLILISIILIGGVLWYFRENAVRQISLEDKITSTPSPSRVSPTPATGSAKLVIDYSKYKIKVLNGSGIGGAAAKGKGILEEEKFVVEEIGNAETSDYDLTIIQAKKEVPKAFLDKLKSVLKESYLLGSNEELKNSEVVDVVIIIGSGKQP